MKTRWFVVCKRLDSTIDFQKGGKNDRIRALLSQPARRSIRLGRSQTHSDDSREEEWKSECERERENSNSMTNAAPRGQTPLRKSDASLAIAIPPFQKTKHHTPSRLFHLPWQRAQTYGRARAVSAERSRSEDEKRKKKENEARNREKLFRSAAFKRRRRFEKNGERGGRRGR